MSKTLLTRIFMAIMCLSVMSATASANIVLDLDVNEGDQGLKTKQVQPGDIVEIELIAQQGAQDIAGFEVVVQFDSQKFKFSSYLQGGLMASAISLPASEAQNGKRISAGFLGGKSAHDSGSLGMLIFEVLQDPEAGSAIVLTEGSFGKSNHIDQFTLNAQVTLQGQQSNSSQSQTSMDTQTNPMGNMGDQGGQGNMGGQGGQGNMGGQGGQGNMGGQGGQGPQDPMQMIQHLPAQLQPAYLETHRLHLQNRLTELNSIRQSLGLTHQYLFNANEQEKQVIGRVLRNFYHNMHKPDPNQAPTPPPTNINDLLNMMFQSVEQDIQHVTQELANIR